MSDRHREKQIGVIKPHHDAIIPGSSAAGSLVSKLAKRFENLTGMSGRPARSRSAIEHAELEAFLPKMQFSRSTDERVIARIPVFHHSSLSVVTLCYTNSPLKHAPLMLFNDSLISLERFLTLHRLTLYLITPNNTIYLKYSPTKISF
jgi:hypothetical protein